MVLPLLALVVLAAPGPAELNERFSRAVRLFEANRVADALLEFEALDQLKPNASVRFNLAHCHARLGHAVRAVDLLDVLLADPGKLQADRLASATALRDEQRARVTTLDLAVDVGPLEGVLEVDGSSSRVTLPLSVRVDPGPRNLTFQSTGYFPSRQVFTALPGATTKLVLSLVRAERPPARVRVKCAVPAVELRVDGVLLAATPLSTPLLLVAGPHTLEATRLGYAPFVQPLALSEGVEEVVEVTLVPVGEGAATLRIKPTEEHAVVSVNGQLARADVPLRLPPGPHEVSVTREGFFSTRQLVSLQGSLELDVVLEPTSETLVELSARRGRHRFWGALGAGVGGALAVAGGLIWGINQPRLFTLNEDVQRLKALCFPAPGMPGGVCPEAQYRTQTAYLTEAEWVRTGGVSTLGVGLAVAGAGVIALLTAPDLSRYEARGATGPLAPLSLSVGPGGAAVSGQF